MVQSLIKVSQKHQHVIVKGVGGVQGKTGATGPQGPTGPQGEKGDAATIDVGQVSTLPAGSQATVTNIGTSSDAIFSFGIPKGDKGDRGEAGAGLQITGTVATYADLPNNLGPEDAGKAYFVQADGKLYVWTGTAFPADGQGTQFEGPAGPQGPAGPAGYSPTATVTQGTGSATITITDASGTTTATVYNGTTPTIDSALSTTSENPVQNKIITNALNGKQATLNAGDVTNSLVANGAITGADNSDTSVDDSNSKIALNTIGTPNLRDGTVTGDKIAAETITSHNIDFTTLSDAIETGTLESPYPTQVSYQKLGDFVILSFSNIPVAGNNEVTSYPMPSFLQPVSLVTGTLTLTNSSYVPNGTAYALLGGGNNNLRLRSTSGTANIARGQIMYFTS